MIDVASFVGDYRKERDDFIDFEVNKFLEFLGMTVTEALFYKDDFKWYEWPDGRKQFFYKDEVVLEFAGLNFCTENQSVTQGFTRVYEEKSNGCDSSKTTA